MKPDDLFSWRTTYFERKKQNPATPGKPSDRKKSEKPAPKAEPKTAFGGIIAPAITQKDMIDAIVRQMSQQRYQITYNLQGTWSSPAETRFSGKEFAVGTAKGARSFRVDSLGRLTGIHFRQVWVPGENVAECKADHPHAAGAFPDCKCGFYGYYDGSNDYYVEGYVSAVVEGYGEAVMGDKGFRVTKARILALSIDDSVPAKEAHLVRRNYANIPTFDSFHRMIAEFPTDYDLSAPIPSPDEDDFWTRSA